MIDEYDHLVISWVSAHWPGSTVPTVVAGLAVLALVARRWDQKDREAQVANYHGRARR